MFLVTNENMGLCLYMLNTRNISPKITLQSNYLPKPDCNMLTFQLDKQWVRVVHFLYVELNKKVIETPLSNFADHYCQTGLPKIRAKKLGEWKNALFSFNFAFKNWNSSDFACCCQEYY